MVACIYIYSFKFINDVCTFQAMDNENQALPVERLRAIQEQLCGFLLDEVIDPKGEYHCDGSMLPRNPLLDL